MVVFRILLSHYFVISLDSSISRIQLIWNVNSQLIKAGRNEMGKFMTVPRTSTWSTMGRSIRVVQCLGLMNLPMKNQPRLISSFTLSVSMDIIINCYSCSNFILVSQEKKPWRKKQKTVCCDKLKWTRSLFDCDSSSFSWKGNSQFQNRLCTLLVCLFVRFLFDPVPMYFHFNSL